MSPVVTLYQRDGCHLCGEARDAIAALRAELPEVAVEEVDIESDDGLLREYLERIPVIAVNGRIVSELVPDAPALRTAVLDTLRT